MEPEAVANRTNARSDSNVNNTKDIVNHKDRQVFNTEVVTPKTGPGTAVYDSLVKEGREFFLEYIDWLGLLQKTNVIVLPDLYHYYYDLDDLAEVETIINLKPLNREKRADSFLESIANGLPVDGSLVGCFVEENKVGRSLMKNQLAGSHYLDKDDIIENGIISSNQVFNRFVNLMDSRIFRKLTESNVRKLLTDSGFIVEDMTEINGITYFHSRKSSRLD